MIKVNIVAVGKIKEKYFRDGIEEYAKRLKKYCNFNIIEIAEENYSKTGVGEIANILTKEGESISTHLKGHVIAMAIEGKECSSEKLAQKLKNFVDIGKEVTFVIGGSYGLSKDIKDGADELVSLSQATFPHAMFRMILTEQIYRAFCIIQGTPYHK